MNVVEVRCPVGPQKLFTKLKLGEEFGRYLPNNLLEISCSDCTRRLRDVSRTRFIRVLHRYNFVGELIVTVGVDGEGAEEVLR